MLSDVKNLGTLTAIHTDFGSSRDDLLVVEYDVPQTKVKQTLFYKYGQLSVPKWSLIPAAILAFGLLTVLLAVIVSSILSQSAATVTYSQTCSKTSLCKSGVGLICGSQSKCTCPSQQYWYGNTCTNQPTYTQQCNQTSECRTDLGLVCADVNGQCNCPAVTTVQTCDCPSTSYWTGTTCITRSNYLGACSVSDSSYQCISSLYCNGAMCVCAPNLQYWNVTASECYAVDEYLSLCDPSTPYSCDASASLYCLTAGLGAQCPFNATVNSTSCDCAYGTYWNGGSCVRAKNVSTACFWNCECNLAAGLRCLNMSCVCPQKFYWSTSSGACLPQKNYSQSPCYNTSECDTTQGLICNVVGTACNCPSTSTPNMCDCSSTRYYDYNLTSCQPLKLYNETCLQTYMCDSALGLFCQTNLISTTNCSCPEPIRLNMCDCNMTSYWDGVTCAARLAPNISCSFEYQCQAGFTCIVNETDIGIFSDVCRCPLGYYYVSGSGCVLSRTYTSLCVGSYQCNELAPLSCRYNDTGLTCLDSTVTPLPACDCEDNYFYDTTAGLCLPPLTRLSGCTLPCQCASPYQCISNQCNCANYYSSLNQTCVNYLRYGDQCTSSTGCAVMASALMTCVIGTCGCNSTGFWSGTQCTYTINFRSICQSTVNCYTGLACRTITAIDSNARCSCPSSYYYSPLNQRCILCNGSDNNNYYRYVINYPTSDLCVAVRFPVAPPSQSLTFSTANSNCASLSSLTPSDGPQLISVHNQSELNYIAAVLQPAGSQSCPNRLYYIGLNPGNLTFYDGTPYSSAFQSPVLFSSSCLTYCVSSSSLGSLYSSSCTSGAGAARYGAICDYRIR